MRESTQYWQNTAQQLSPRQSLSVIPSFALSAVWFGPMQQQPPRHGPARAKRQQLRLKKSVSRVSRGVGG